MASKLENQVDRYLRQFISSNYPDLIVQREKEGDFGIRYDFVIPTSPPICIEVDGENHRSYNDFFFKTTEEFDKYKANDNLRKKLHYARNIILINVPDNEKWTYGKFKKLFEGYEDVLEKGLPDYIKRELEEKKKKDLLYAVINKQKKEKLKILQREAYLKQKEQQKKYKPEESEEQKEFKKKRLEEQRKYRKEQYKKQKERMKEAQNESN